MDRGQSTNETRTYRWRCPICGIARLGVYDTADGFRAVNALRTHIQSTDEDGHGPVHQLPADLDSETLSEYVHRL